jgi:hypothetical protein
MKSLKKKISALAMIALLCTASSCDIFDLDVNKNPNQPSQAALNLLLTNVQLNASATFAAGLNDATMGFMALTTSTDDFNMNNSSWNATWNYLYSNPLKDLQGIIDATAEQRAAGAANPHYEGIAKVLKAYYFSLMVDLWGDVPYSDAFKGNGAEPSLAPAFDDDQAIYSDLLTLLDEAVVHFDETSPVPVNGDVMYGGDVDLWTLAANSLKLKLLVQISRKDPSVVSQITALIDAGNLIEDPDGAEDFQFQFGNLTNPDDRHPAYQAGYASGDAAYTYFGHQFMYEMLAKGDPRRRYYFKRQTNVVLNQDDPTDKQTTPCSQRTDCKYGYFPLSDFVANGVFDKDAADLTDAEKAFLAGFFGRDRSDPSGVPNDATMRTNVGVYPSGGLFDDGPEAGGDNKGSGAGIFPMVTSWMVDLYKIEANLALGVVTPETPRDMFEQALREQIAKVMSLGADLDPMPSGSPLIPTDPQIDTYVNERLDEYDDAGDNNARLRIVIKEAWFMNFGNGFEIYNTFRRTKFPSDLQIPLQRPRQFALRLPYALDEVNLNANTPNVTFDAPSSAVFWDIAPQFQF